MTDWQTVGISLATALVSGGGIGGFVSWRVANRESNDRLAALQWEREQFDASNERAHATWLREQRFQIYNDFFRNISTFAGYMTTTNETKKVELATRITEGYHELLLVTAASARDKFETLYDEAVLHMRKSKPSEEDQGELRLRIDEMRVLLTPHITNETI